MRRIALCLMVALTAASCGGGSGDDDQGSADVSVVEEGDGQAAEKLLPLVYDELRRLATQKMAQAKPGQSLLCHGAGP